MRRYSTNSCAQPGRGPFSTAISRSGSTLRRAIPSSIVATKKRRQPALASAGATIAAPKPYASALTTAAQHAGSTLCASKRQFATIPARSISRMAPERSAGSLPIFTVLVNHGGYMIGRYIIVELCRLGIEDKLYGVGWPVTLLRYNHLSKAIHLITLRLPFFNLSIVLLILIIWSPHRHTSQEIVFLAEDEHDDIRVLLDRARFAQVGEQWALVLALLDGTR